MTELKTKKHKRQITPSQKSKNKSRSKLQNINRQKITFQDIYQDLIETKQKIQRVPLTNPQPFQFSILQIENKINSEVSQQLKLKHRFNAYLLNLISSNQTSIEDQETNECVIIQNARNCTPSQFLSCINNEIKCLKQLKQEEKGKSKSAKRKFKVSNSNKKSKKQPYDDPIEQEKIKLQIEKLNQYQQIRASKFQQYEDAAQNQEEKTIEDKQKDQIQSSIVSTPKKKNKIQKMSAHWQYQSRHLKQRRLQIKSRFRNPENDEVDQTQLDQWQQDMKQVFKKLLGDKFNNYWLDIKQEKTQFQEYYQKKEIKKQQQICQKQLYKKEKQQPSLQLLQEHQRNEESQERSEGRSRNFDSIFNDNQDNEDGFLGYHFQYDNQYDKNSFFDQNENYF